MLTCEEPVEFGTLSCVSNDTRRSIFEFTFKGAGGSTFQDFFIKDGAKPLGQHFHKKKEEIFYFLEGGGIIRTALVDHDGKIVGEIRAFEIKKGDAIRIMPFHAHRFDLEAGTHFVAYSSEPFDSNDMIPCPIEVK